MAIPPSNPTEKIRDLLKAQRRSYQWLADETGIPYKRILTHVKHDKQQIGLVDSIRISRALGVALDDLAKEVV